MTHTPEPSTGPDSRAKEPVSAALAGPYAHPFHPILVTVPIGAWVSSLVLDIGSRIVAHPEGLAEGARWLVGIGVIGALVAATVGFLDFLTIPSGTVVHRVAVTHMVLNLAITAGFAIGFAWRAGTPAPTPYGPLVLSLVCLAALGVSGSLGGRLAYRYGVRVAAEDVQAAAFDRTQQGRRRAQPVVPAPRHGE